jgi:hypothetical protein
LNWCWPRERTLGYKSVRHSVVIWVLLSELDSNPDIDHVLMRPVSKIVEHVSGSCDEDTSVDALRRLSAMKAPIRPDVMDAFLHWRIVAG